MGSSPTPSTVSGGGWRWNGGGKNNGVSNGNSEACVLPSTFAYFLSSFVVLGVIGSLYGRYMVSPNVRRGIAALGCLDDSEGSWALGVYYGDSPFSLRPIEDVSFLLSFLPINQIHVCLYLCFSIIIDFLISMGDEFKVQFFIYFIFIQ